MKRYLIFITKIPCFWVGIVLGGLVFMIYANTYDGHKSRASLPPIDKKPVMSRVNRIRIDLGFEALIEKLDAEQSIYNKEQLFIDIISAAAKTDLNLAKRIWDNSPRNLPPLARAKAISRILNEGHKWIAKDLLDGGWPISQVMMSARQEAKLNKSEFLQLISSHAEDWNDKVKNDVFLIACSGADRPEKVFLEQLLAVFSVDSISGTVSQRILSGLPSDQRVYYLSQFKSQIFAASLQAALEPQQTANSSAIDKFHSSINSANDSPGNNEFNNAVSNATSKLILSGKPFNEVIKEIGSVGQHASVSLDVACTYFSNSNPTNYLIEFLNQDIGEGGENIWLSKINDKFCERLDLERLKQLLNKAKPEQLNSLQKSASFVKSIAKF